MITAVIPFRDWSIVRLEECVACLRRLPSINEILLVDFGSTEPPAAIDGCRLVRVVAPLWCLAEANNIGIAEATNDIVLKIDADVQLLLDDPTLADLARGLMDGEVSFYVLQPTDFQYENGRKARKRMRPEWGEGCANLFKRGDVLEIGGFDTRYFDYGGEDNDLCQRLRRYGKRVEYFKSDKVLHERHLPSRARTHGRFTDTQKKTLLADQSIFRARPFRHSDYAGKSSFGPTITVAIATTDRPNREAHLYHCLRGLVGQTFQDFEVRICENGSPPPARLKAPTLHKAFPTLDIHLHALDEPSIPKARNLITDHARGFYIAVHDDDDFSLPMRFEEQLDCMAMHRGAHGCHSSWVEFDEANGGLTSYIGQVRDIDHLMRRPGKVTLHSTGFYRRDVLSRFRYDESLTLGSDYDLNIRMALAGLEVPHSEKFHAMRRLHVSSVSQNGTVAQRDLAARANGAYRYVLGERFLSAIQAEQEKKLWVTGYPTLREMLAYLPSDFGAFRIDLDLEAVLTLGFDPIFGAAQGESGFSFAGLDFQADHQGLGNNTKLVMRSDRPLTAGEAKEAITPLAGVRGASVVSEAALERQRKPFSLKSVRVEKGHRRVISRRFDGMRDALAALPTAVLSSDLGGIEFFAVNEPLGGVHVLLGSYDKASDLEFALGVANSERPTDFFAVSNNGRRGGFNGG